jgi:hypothetical protein
MSDLNIESRVILAMNAKRKNPKLSIRHLAKQLSTYLSHEQPYKLESLEDLQRLIHIAVSQI